MKTVFDESFLNWFERGPSSPSSSMDFGVELDAMANGDSSSDPVALQLSRSLIRIGQTVVEDNLTPVNYEFQLAGAGLTPVSSLSRLLRAIDDGFANGSFTQVSILREGVKILGLDFAATGYTISSGAQSMIVAGALPRSFADLYDLGDFLGRAQSIDTLTRAERLALFSDLSAFGITGLTVKDGATQLFDVQITGSHVHLAVGSTSIDMTGVFPTDFGLLLENVWQFSNAPGTDLSPFAQFGVTDLTMSENGTTLFALTHVDITATTVVAVGGRLYSEWVTDNPEWLESSVTMDMNGHVFYSWNALVRGVGGLVASVLSGLEGNDTLQGLGGRDLLYGGSGRDKLEGGSGSDVLFGGSGSDVLSGSLGNDTMSGGTGNDILRGEDNDDSLSGNAGRDVLYGGAGADTLDGGIGTDVLNGGIGADQFVFTLRGLFTVDFDTVNSFQTGQDKLVFDGPGMTYAAMGADAFVAAYASVEAGGVEIRLNGANTVLLAGLTTLDGLADSLILS